ncbi:excisionase, partial [Oleiphilus sp. HI0009]
KLLTPKQVSEILGVSEQTLAIWRCQKRYPLAYVKVGRYVRYRQDDVSSFLADNTFEA